MSRNPDTTISRPVPSVSRFILWALLLAVMIAVAVFHYSLLAGSVAEILGGRSLVFGGADLANVIAGVIVVLEILTGWLFVESRGMTALLTSEVARALLSTALKLACLYLLYIFAIMETGFVLAADMLTESDATTIDFLAGRDVTAARDDLMRQIAFVAKMAFAFTSPFLLILAPLSADRVVRRLRAQRA